MKTDYLTLRVSPRLKEDFYKFCEDKKTTPGKAIKLFANQFVETGKVSFDLFGAEDYADDERVRVCIYMNGNVRKAFSEACDEYGLPMSVLARSFMNYCVINNSFPDGLESE